MTETETEGQLATAAKPSHITPAELRALLTRFVVDAEAMGYDGDLTTLEAGHPLIPVAYSVYQSVLAAGGCVKHDSNTFRVVPGEEIRVYVEKIDLDLDAPPIGSVQAAAVACAQAWYKPSNRYFNGPVREALKAYLTWIGPVEFDGRIAYLGPDGDIYSKPLGLDKEAE